MKTTHTLLFCLAALATVVVSAQSVSIIPLDHRDSLLVQMGYEAGAAETAQQLYDYMDSCHVVTLANQRRVEDAGDYNLGAGYAWLDLGIEYMKDHLEDKFGIKPKSW